MLPLPTNFLSEIATLSSSNSEPNIFSLGTRGYYENPTSDLLAFFLAPDKPHQLGATFLTAFLKAISRNDLVGSSILKIDREAGTAENNRIDLAIHGRSSDNQKLLILIENKIRHVQDNPFESYEIYAQAQAADILLKVVLSPDGTSPNRWIGLSYDDFIREASNELTNSPLNIPYNKWHYFACDFLAHLTSETTQPNMTEAEIKFVEANLSNLKKAQDLAKNYRIHLLKMLPSLIDEHSGKEGAFSKDDGWCIRIRHPLWQTSEVAWWNDPESDDGLKLSIYIEHPSKDTLSIANNKFSREFGMVHGTEQRERWHRWVSMENFPNREAAEQQLRETSDTLFSIFAAPLEDTK